MTVTASALRSLAKRTHHLSATLRAGAVELARLEAQLLEPSNAVLANIEAARAAMAGILADLADRQVVLDEDPPSKLPPVIVDGLRASFDLFGQRVSSLDLNELRALASLDDDQLRRGLSYAVGSIDHQIATGPAADDAPKPVEADDAPPKPTEPMLQFFAYEHLPRDLARVSAPFCDLAWWMANELPRNPERSAALRKLLEAKDCAVRAKLYVADGRLASLASLDGHLVSLHVEGHLVELRERDDAETHPIEPRHAAP